MLISLVAIIIVLVWWFSPSQIIKRQTQKIIQCLDIPETATKTYRALKTNSFSNLLARSVSCRVDIAEYQSEFSRDQLIESHQMYAYNVASAVAEASNIEVHIIDDKNARTNADIYFAITSKKIAAIKEKIEINLDWEKTDTGKWRLTNVEIVDISNQNQQ